MERQPKPIAVEEHPGDQYADLGTAQRVALRPLASDLAATIRTLLAAGILIIRDGCIVPAGAEKGLNN